MGEILAALITGIVGIITTNLVNEHNHKENERNIEFVKNENEITREREDNAVQRGMADFDASGINPILAAAGGRAASSTAVSAPQSNFQKQFFDPSKMLEKLSPHEYEMRKLDEEQKKSEADLTDKKVESQEIQNAIADLQKNILEYNFQFFKKYDLPTTSSGIPKQVAEGAAMIPGVMRYVEGFNSLGENPIDKVVDFALTPAVKTPITNASSNFVKGLYVRGKQAYQRVKTWKENREQRRIRDYASRYINN